VAPARQGQHGQALDQAHEEAEGARARPHDDRRAQRDRLGRRGEQRLLHGQARGEMARRRAGGGHEAAEVDDPAHARRARRRREPLRRAPFLVREGAAGRALHRVDQVVRGLHAVERTLQPAPGEDVAEHQVRERQARGAHPLGRAREAPDGMAVALEARHERRADVARDSGHQDRHR
jgi:hypothetical protein